MLILPLDANPADHEHINRFVDLNAGELYLVETEADYAALPLPIQTMLGDQWYILQGLEPPVVPE